MTFLVLSKLFASAAGLALVLTFLGMSAFAAREAWTERTYPTIRNAEAILAVSLLIVAMLAAAGHSVFLHVMWGA